MGWKGLIILNTSIAILVQVLFLVWALAKFHRHGLVWKLRKEGKQWRSSHLEASFVNGLVVESHYLEWFFSLVFMKTKYRCRLKYLYKGETTKTSHELSKNIVLVLELYKKNLNCQDIPSRMGHTCNISASASQVCIASAMCNDRSSR